MASLTGVFFDTSVLVAGMVDLGPSSVHPLALLDRVATGEIADPATSWHNCLEFFSVSTRLPEEYRLAPEIALRFLEEEVFSRFVVHQLEPEKRRDFLLSALARGISGGRIFDAHIAAVARQVEAGVVVTENRRHFLSLVEEGTRVLTASELVAEL